VRVLGHAAEVVEELGDVEDIKRAARVAGRSLSGYFDWGGFPSF
jgi:hypothetical protein